MNLFKIRVPFIIHASCWANFHSSFQIIYFGFWKVTERQTQHYSLILFSWLLNLFEIRRRDNSILLVVGKFKSHLSSSGYLGLILWNCHNRPPLKTFFHLGRNNVFALLYFIRYFAAYNEQQINSDVKAQTKYSYDANETWNAKRQDNLQNIFFRFTAIWLYFLLRFRLSWGCVVSNEFLP